jgi:hypothetical protein
MLWPIPVVRGEILTSKETRKPNDTKDLATLVNCSRVEDSNLDLIS